MDHAPTAPRTGRRALAGAGLALACAWAAGCSSAPPAPSSEPRASDARATFEARGAPEAPPLSAVESSALRERAIAALEDLAFDDWALIRANAVEAMQASPSRVEPLARAAMADENLGVRFTGAMTVGKLRLSRSVEPARALLNDPSDQVRLAAIFALARNGEPVDQGPLGAALAHGTAGQRMNAAYILGELGNTSAAPMLRDAWRRAGDSSEDVLRPIERRLLRLQIAEALIKLGDARSIDTVRAALYPSSVDEAEAAALAAQILGEVRAEAAVAELIEIVEATLTGRADRRRDPSRIEFLYPPELRLAAATALARMGYPDGAFLVPLFEGDPEPARRAQVATLAGESGRSDAARRLDAMLEGDPSPVVRVAAAAAILRVTR